MTRGRKVKSEAAEKPQESQSSFASQQSTEDIVMSSEAEPSDPRPASSTGPSNHGLPTPMSSFQTINDLMAEHSVADHSRRSTAPSLRQRSTAPSLRESGMHLVGKEAQVLIDAINDFRKFGVDHVVQLPELVLVGDQSAGKSSLMGALTEIHLPRASGICTRCPALIKTSEAESWTCKVSLHKQYRYAPGGSKKVTADKPFPPWELQPLIVTPFQTIDNKRELEDVLRWAQIAILNDLRPYTHYLPGSVDFRGDTTTEAKFSPNVVSVEISGPGLPSLSFYDLPGIFQNTSDKEDEYLIKVIENLARYYIKRPKALIICAIPMSIDPANSRTRKIISDLKAEDRCIGVLTMADRLQDGQSHTDFENILNKKAHRLGHGYFVTKLPGGASGSSEYDPAYHQKARAAEQMFFDTAKPWSRTWKEFRPRCGTMPLQRALSQKFAGQIKLSIPDIKVKIAQRQEQIDDALEGLPDLPSENVFFLVIQHLNIFSGDVQKVLEGGSNHNDFHADFAKICNEFRKALLDMRPGVLVQHPSDHPKKANEIIEIDDDSDSTIPPSRSRTVLTNGQGKKHGTDPSTPTPAKRFRPGELGPPQYDGSGDGRVKLERANSTDASPTKANGAGMLPPLTPNRRTSQASSSNGRPIQSNFADIVAGNRASSNISLTTIRRTIQEHAKAGLVGVTSPQVYSTLCLRITQGCQLPCDRLLSLIMKMLRNAATNILNNTFRKYLQTQLYRQSQILLQAFFDDLESDQHAALVDMCNLERENDFTINQPAFETYKHEEGLTIYKARSTIRAKLSLDGKITTKLEDARKMTEKAEKELPPDPFAPELEVAVYVRGYYKVMALRLADNACLSIKGKLFKQVRSRIAHYLEKELDVYHGGEERCRELLEEDETTAKRRSDLKREKKSLESFTNRLIQLARDTANLEEEEGADREFGLDDEDMEMKFDAGAGQMDEDYGVV